MRRFAKPFQGVSSDEGSNPSLPAECVQHVSDIHVVEKNADELIAWAAGIFDADGSASFHVYRKRARTQPELFVYQAGVVDTPEVLLRRTSPWSKQPQYRWSVGSAGGVRFVIERLWPWLDESKRTQAEAALATFEHLHSENRTHRTRS